MVAKVALNEIRQDRDEPIRSFGARIRGQAGVCKYLLECTCGRDINYSTHILRDIVIWDLADPEIQLDLLSNANQDMTLDRVATHFLKKNQEQFKNNLRTKF